MRDILTYPDRCLKPSTDLAIAEVRLILDRDRNSTAMLRVLASFYDIPWRNALGQSKHLLNQHIKQALSAYPNVYQALNSQ
ncbi:MAG: hypothetical protein AAGG53_04410 [Cyanobacteria bacterium P01_H01_bin.152]